MQSAIAKETITYLEKDIATMRGNAAHCLLQQRKWKRLGNDKLAEWYEGRAGGFKQASEYIQNTVFVVKLGGGLS